MEKPLIMVSSVTYAMKGKQILNNAGIRCEIERTQKRDVKNGCGYSLYVPQNADEAELRNSVPPALPTFRNTSLLRPDPPVLRAHSVT